MTSEGRAPDAIICGNDVMAIGCVDTARHEFKLDVPGQLSVVGFDGVEPAAWLSYNLTTLRQPVKIMAQAAANMLTALIATPGTAPEKSRPAPGLHERRRLLPSDCSADRAAS